MRSGLQRRDPAQPVALLIGSANPSPSLLSHNPLTATKNVLCAVGVVPTRHCRSRGVSPR
ncbi:TPA: hypothetical protein G9E63_004365 [Salmonella enterica]|uniref:Uncharacterized protein n=1 Tax=Salmonella enterica TaxID=28901 RepID=A0A750MDK6_SALER|nr:hypothetical protein [Salmonella enterica]